MKNLSLLLLLFTLSLLQVSKTHADESIQLDCMDNAKLVLFLKAQSALVEKFKEDIFQKSMQNLYTDFEAKKILKDPTFPYPVSLCSGEIILSINEFTTHLEKGCSSADIEFDLKDFNLVLLNELSNHRIKNTKKSFDLRLSKARSYIKETSKDSYSCVEKMDPLSKIMALSLSDQPLKVCHDIIQIINFYRQAHLQCE